MFKIIFLTGNAENLLEIYFMSKHLHVKIFRNNLWLVYSFKRTIQTTYDCRVIIGCHLSPCVRLPRVLHERPTEAFFFGISSKVNFDEVIRVMDRRGIVYLRPMSRLIITEQLVKRSQNRTGTEQTCYLAAPDKLEWLSCKILQIGRSSGKLLQDDA